MSTVEWVTLAFSVIASTAALGILITRHLMYGALFLLACLLSISVLYALAGAEFLFASQIILYAGGVVVLILFGIMVTAKAGTRVLEVKSKKTVPSILLAIIVFGLLVWQIDSLPVVGEEGIPLSGHSTAIGTQLVASYSLPLEVAGILLLASLVGAAFTSTQKPSL